MYESNYLKEDINNIHQLLAIPCLKELMMEDLASLLKLSKLRQFNADECIICEGDKDPWIYFLLSGAVRIEKNGVSIWKINKTGELFGEMRVLDGLARSASVFADGKTICLAVDTSASHRLRSPKKISKLVRIFYEIFSKVLCLRLRNTNEELVKTKKELARLKASGKSE